MIALSPEPDAFAGIALAISLFFLAALIGHPRHR